MTKRLPFGTAGSVGSLAHNAGFMRRKFQALLSRTPKSAPKSSRLQLQQNGLSRAVRPSVPISESVIIKY